MTAMLAILALILALPLQTAGFSKAMMHIQEHLFERSASVHDHGHSHASDHDHSHESEDHANALADSNTPGEHSHGDDPTPHSHAKELSLTFLQSGSNLTESSFETKPFCTALKPIFDLTSSNGRHSYLSLLRPPIQA